jgi:FixJ family two-component response regulator
VNEAQELVCVVDDDPSVRRALKRLFKSAGYAAETFSCAEEYLARETSSGPTCLVLDVRMPGLNGLDLQRKLDSRGVGEQIVFLTGFADVAACTRAMKEGAVDFLVKPFDDEELITAVACALGRAKEYLRRHAERRAARGMIDRLTPREFHVMRLVVVGMLNKQIAAELKTAEKTVKVHRGRVMHKLGVTSVAELVRFSQSAGITPLPI